MGWVGIPVPSFYCRHQQLCIENSKACITHGSTRVMHHPLVLLHFLFSFPNSIPSMHPWIVDTNENPRFTQCSNEYIINKLQIKSVLENVFGVEHQGFIVGTIGISLSFPSIGATKVETIIICLLVVENKQSILCSLEGVCKTFHGAVLPQKFQCLRFCLSRTRSLNSNKIIIGVLLMVNKRRVICILR